MAARSGEAADREEAVRRLAAAVDGFDPDSHARPRALCLARLAVLHLAAGELDQGAAQTRRALQAATGIRSARLSYAITHIRTTATNHPDQPAVHPLIEEIDAAENPGGSTMTLAQVE